MGKVKEMVMDIQEAIVDAGPNVDVEVIANALGVPVPWVEAEYEAMCESDDGYEPSEYDEWMSFDPDC